MNSYRRAIVADVIDALTRERLDIGVQVSIRVGRVIEVLSRLISVVAITDGGKYTLRERSASERKVMQLFGVPSKGTIGSLM